MPLESGSQSSWGKSGGQRNRMPRGKLVAKYIEAYERLTGRPFE
jgi:hypothetical protein